MSHVRTRASTILDNVPYDADWGACQKIEVLWLYTFVLVLVLVQRIPRVLLAAPKKTASYRDYALPHGWDSCISMLCTMLTPIPHWQGPRVHRHARPRIHKSGGVKCAGPPRKLRRDARLLFKTKRMPPRALHPLLVGHHHPPVETR